MTASDQVTKNPPNAFVRNVCNPLGFSKTYNFILWFIFAGAMTGFVLARLMYLDFDTYYCPPTPRPGSTVAPGECYYFTTFTRYKVGFMMHIATVLPAGLLAVAQFTPYIRRRWIVVHRIFGYLSMLLYVISVVGALMIARHSFGGGIEIQVWIGFVGIGTLICFLLALFNIKRLQIEQHRAWMLRGWFYAGSIITQRLILFTSFVIISNHGYHAVWPCAKIAFTISDTASLLTDYPACSSFVDGSNLEQVAVVAAKMTSGAGVGAGLNLNFGMALWLALAIHAIGIEIYLHLTPKEAERLRNVSYQRQLKAGMKNPGSAGLTVDRLGDANPWVPESMRESSINSLPTTAVDINESQGAK